VLLLCLLLQREKKKIAHDQLLFGILHASKNLVEMSLFALRNVLRRGLHRPMKGFSVRNFAMEDILDDPTRSQYTMVSEFDEAGFVINKIHVQNSVILLPKHFMLWNTKNFEDIDVASLDLFSFIYPTLEVIIVGCGETAQKRLPRDVLEYFKMKGIVLEQMDSMNAVQTFNLLISEGRNVGAAILPLFPFPDHIEEEDWNA
jgi:NADH dehydrogenase [ubiquinone] 1 alpha subcomplex assembly factor 3